MVLFIQCLFFIINSRTIHVNIDEGIFNEI